MTAVISAIMQSMVLLELIAYVTLFLNLMDHDKSLVQIVQDHILKVCSFPILENLYLNINLLSDTKKEEHHHFSGSSHHIFH